MSNQANAERLVQLTTELQRAERERDAAQARCTSIMTDVFDVERQLKELVGPNIPLRVLACGDCVVVIQRVESEYDTARVVITVKAVG